MNNKTEDNVEEKRPENVLSAYRDRLKTLRHAQEYAQNGDIPKAVEKYNHYLSVLATYHKTEEKSLNPRHFDPEKDLTEMLLISHAYWDLAKAYDRSPKLANESLRCLQQFINFSLGFKFQHVNAQMLKKYVRSRKPHNKKAFQQALDRLNVESKSCYIATSVYPNNEILLDELRFFKNKLYMFKVFRPLVTNYYIYSPRFLSFLSNKFFLRKFLNNLMFKPIVYITYLLVRTIRRWL